MVKLALTLLSFGLSSYAAAQVVCLGSTGVLPQDMRLNFITQIKKIESCVVSPSASKLPGKLKILYRISTEGKLLSAKIAKPNDLPLDINACLTKVLKPFLWPKGREKFEGAVSYNVTWHPKSNGVPGKIEKDTSKAQGLKLSQGFLTLDRQALSPVLPFAITKKLELEFKDYQIPPASIKALTKSNKAVQKTTPEPMPFYWYLYADVAGGLEPDFVVFLKHKTKPQTWKIATLVQTKYEGFQHHTVITDEEFQAQIPHDQANFEGIFLGSAPCDESANPTFYLLAHSGNKVTFRWSRKWFEKEFSSLTD